MKRQDAPAGTGTLGPTPSSCDGRVLRRTASPTSLTRIEEWRATWSSVVGGLPQTGDGQALPLEHEVLRQCLETAHEELVTQQQAIDELLADLTREHLLVTRLHAAVPVPVVVTDTAGTILEANAAASAETGIHPLQIAHKPLLAYVDPAERGALRNVLSSLTPDTPTRTTFRLVPRRGEPHEVEALLVPDLPTESQAQVRWILGTPGQSRVPEFLVDLVRAARRAETGKELLHAVASLAVTHLPDVDAAVVCIGHPRRPDHLIASSSEAVSLANLQRHRRVGPLLDARCGVTVTRDVAHDPRWPRLAVAASAPARAVIAVPLPEDIGVAGVLALHCLALPEDDTALRTNAALVAELAATLIRDHREVEDLRTLSGQLNEALTSRAVIDQAKGVLMALHGCDPDAAFRQLALLSQKRNVKVRVIAEEIVHQVQASRRPAPRTAATAAAASA